MASPSLTKKRKINEDDNVPVVKSSIKGIKKSRKSSSMISEGASVGTQIDPSIGILDSHLLADLISRKIKEVGAGLSLVEKEPKHISGECLSWIIWRTGDSMATTDSTQHSQSEIRASGGSLGALNICPHFSKNLHHQAEWTANISKTLN